MDTPDCYSCADCGPLVSGDSGDCHSHYVTRVESVVEPTHPPREAVAAVTDIEERNRFAHETGRLR